MGVSYRANRFSPPSKTCTLGQIFGQCPCPRLVGLESGVGLSRHYTFVAPSGRVKSRESVSLSCTLVPIFTSTHLIIADVLPQTKNVKLMVVQKSVGFILKEAVCNIYNIYVKDLKELVSVVHYYIICKLKPPFIITVSFSTADTDISSLGRSAHVLIVEFQSSETTNDNEDRETAGMVERHGLGEERERERARERERERERETEGWETVGVGKDVSGKKRTLVSHDYAL